MIINTGNRTDIPAFFSTWFFNRIKEGFVYVRNPYYAEQVSCYRLDPEVVDCLVFCTKNPQPMLQRLPELHAFHQFWFVTITPYGKDIEPCVPDKEQVMDSFCRLSGQVGIQSIGWRYDPIFISRNYDLDFHIQTFEKMAARLEGFTDQVTISFIDLYEKTKRNFPEARPVSDSEQRILAREIARSAASHHMKVYACMESAFLQEYGIDISGCLTQTVLERAIGGHLRVPKKTTPREGCHCLLGADIGVYNTCGHGCLYCYANYDQKTVQSNLALHDPSSPFLIGTRQPGDVLHPVRQSSWYNGQLTISDLLQGF